MSCKTVLVLYQKTAARGSTGDKIKVRYISVNFGIIAGMEQNAPKPRIAIDLNAVKMMYLRLIDVHRFGNWRLFFDEEVQADGEFTYDLENTPPWIIHKADIEAINALYLRLAKQIAAADAYFLRRHNEKQAKRNHAEGLTHKSAAPRSASGPDSTRREHDKGNFRISSENGSRIPV